MKHDVILDGSAQIRLHHVASGASEAAGSKKARFHRPPEAGLPGEDYLKTAIPSQLISERGSNLVVINPGSANIRVGLAQQDPPFTLPSLHRPMLNSQVTTAQHMEREKAYDIIASLLKIPFLDEEVANSSSFQRKMGRVDGYNPQNVRKDSVFAWTDVYEKQSSTPVTDMSKDKDLPSTSLDQHEKMDMELGERKYRSFICGEEALKISPTEGHFNISQDYPMQQVYEDLHTIWDWILVEKLHIPQSERNMYSAILVVPETFDNREIKEVLSIVLRDLQFSSAVVHQVLLQLFGNGLSTACIVNMGAQVTSVICIEDGVALPTSEKTLPFGGEDISRCLLWTQRHHQTWPQVRTDMLTKPIDMLMLNELKESYCYIQEGEVDAVAVVHSYEDGMPAASHRTRLTALNVPPMGLFYPTLLVPDVYPPPPRSWFNDYEDMLEETWHFDYPRRPGHGG
ncbi:hypothetical protein NL676_021149 [Syzygium grande]|nr:hypothetical protein NL676_021149 [Syzygium grande]